MSTVERILKALANRRRLAIVSYLRSHRTACVVEIAESLHFSYKATSRHLRLLSAAAIVEHEQLQRYMYYSLGNPPRQLGILLKTILMFGRT